MRRRWVALLLIAMVNSPAAENEPFACVLLGKASARVQVNGVLESPPLRLSDCSGITPATDGVTMCYVGPDGRRTCTELPSNAKVKPPDGASRGTSTKLAPTVMLLLRGDVQTRPGMTRAGGPVQGFPTGIVYLDGPDLLFPTNEDPRLAGVAELDLKLAGAQAPELRAFRANAGFTLPTASLAPGATYVWTTWGSSGALTGRFTVFSDDALALAKGLRDIDADPALSLAAKSYLKADLFEEYGLKYNRDRELVRVRAALAAQ